MKYKIFDGLTVETFELIIRISMNRYFFDFSQASNFFIVEVIDNFEKLSVHGKFDYGISD
jgi:hypothetical protein